MQLIKSALILGALSVSTVVFAADATLSVTGEVLDQTCAIKSTSQNKTVVLPTIGKNALPSTGSTAGYTEFTIEFDRCNATFAPGNATSGKSKIFAFFTPSDTQLHAATGTLQNTQATTTRANNVNVQLTNVDKTPILLQNRYNDTNRFASYTGVAMTKGSTEYTVKYGAQYYAVGTVSSGRVQAQTTFTVGYK